MVCNCLAFAQMTALQLEPSEVRRVVGLAARHLRMLTHQLGHETHVTNEQLFAQLKFDPVQQLIKEARNNHDRLASLSSLLQPSG